MTTSQLSPDERGAQRLSRERLAAFEDLRFGMFLHFGMSTFDGDELSRGDKPASTYAPAHLDVDQWIQVAADAGMRYAVLTTKHVAGHCLWPTDLNDYNVGAAGSGDSTDVVGEFVAACERHGLRAGIYYCSWDNHNQFGSLTPTYARGVDPFTTEKYREFQQAQLAELTSRYGRFAQYWIDIPTVLGGDGRRTQYRQLAELAPDAMIVTNSGFARYRNRLDPAKAWPTDAMEIERAVPSSTGRAYDPWHTLEFGNDEDGNYYLPGEVCETIGQEWFAINDDHPREPHELLGIRLLCRSRGTNLLLNVPPSTNGIIEKPYVDALTRLAADLERV